MRCAAVSRRVCVTLIGGNDGTRLLARALEVPALSPTLWAVLLAVAAAVLVPLAVHVAAAVDAPIAGSVLVPAASPTAGVRAVPTPLAVEVPVAAPAPMAELEKAAAIPVPALEPMASVVTRLKPTPADVDVPAALA